MHQVTHYNLRDDIKSFIDLSDFQNLTEFSLNNFCINHENMTLTKSVNLETYLIKASGKFMRRK